MNDVEERIRDEWIGIKMAGLAMLFITTASMILYCLAFTFADMPNVVINWHRMIPVTIVCSMIFPFTVLKFIQLAFKK